MDAIEFAGQIVDFIRRRPGASFAELANEWPEHFSDGNMEMGIETKKASNIVLWSGVSKLAIDDINYARENLSVELSPTVEFTYLIDGHMLRLPVAQSIRHYKKPHWAPVVLKLRHA